MSTSPLAAGVRDLPASPHRNARVPGESAQGRPEGLSVDPSCRRFLGRFPKRHWEKVSSNWLAQLAPGCVLFGGWRVKEGQPRGFCGVLSGLSGAKLGSFLPRSLEELVFSGTEPSCFAGVPFLMVSWVFTFSRLFVHFWV